MNRWQIILTIAVIAQWCGVVRAEPRVVMPDNPVGKEVRDAATAFFKTIGQGDGRAAKEHFAGEADQAELLDAYIEWVNSHEALSKQVKDKFGEIELGKGVPQIGLLMRYYAERQQEKLLVLNGDFASIGTDDKLFDEGMELHRIDGTWKVTHLNSDHSVGGMDKVFKAYTSAANAVSRDLQSGKFESMTEVMTELNVQYKKGEDLMRDRALETPRVLPINAVTKWLPPESVELGRYWGKTLFSPEIKKLLSLMPGTPNLSAWRESIRLSGAEAGMSLVFDGNGGLTLITLFGGGVDGFGRYPGGLPNGLAFAETRRDVEKLLGKPPESGGSEFGSYNATYPQLGLTIYYGKGGLRDPENPVTKVLWSLPRKGFEAAGKGPAGPRVSFRLEATDPAVAADLMVDPLDPAGKRTIRVEREVLLDEKSIEAVRPTMARPKSNELAIGIEMTEEGAKKLKAITGTNVGHRLAIILDGEVLMAPNIRSEVGKNLLITMGKDPKNKEQMTVMGRIHAAVFALPEIVEKK